MVMSKLLFLLGAMLVVFQTFGLNAQTDSTFRKFKGLEFIVGSSVRSINGSGSDFFMVHGIGYRNHRVEISGRMCIEPVEIYSANRSETTLLAQFSLNLMPRSAPNYFLGPLLIGGFSNDSFVADSWEFNTLGGGLSFINRLKCLDIYFNWTAARIDHYYKNEVAVSTEIGIILSNKTFGDVKPVYRKQPSVFYGVEPEFGFCMVRTGDISVSVPWDLEENYAASNRGVDFYVGVKFGNSRAGLGAGYLRRQSVSFQYQGFETNIFRGFAFFEVGNGTSYNLFSLRLMTGIVNGSVLNNREWYVGIAPRCNLVKASKNLMVGIGPKITLHGSEPVADVTYDNRYNWFHPTVHRYTKHFKTTTIGLSLSVELQGNRALKPD